MLLRAAVVSGWVVLAVWSPGCTEAPKRPEPALEDARPLPAEAPGYVGSEACRGCHEAQHEGWLGSHHQLAMQVADRTTVLGDFEGATASYFAEAVQFDRRDEAFFVKALDGAGNEREFRVRYTFGAFPLQQYLVETEPGRLQAFPFAWDTRDEGAGGQRWFHLQPEEYVEPGDPLHWTGLQFNWNNNCADCHSTRLIKGYDQKTRGYATEFEEVSVGCEACHGPGSKHVAAVEVGDRNEDASFPTRLPDSEARVWNFVEGRDIAVLTSDAPPTDELEICARCHSRRADLGDDAFDFHDRYRLAALDETLYFDDGQIKDEVYVFGSFLQSKMHAAGVVCSDCHEPHSATLRAEGNALCTRCHKAAVYDGPSHTFHPAGGEGSRCTDCHMPKRTYMVIDDRGDHRFDVPRPALSARIGAPDPCVGCHTNKTSAWAERQIARRFTERSAHPFAEALHAARSQSPHAEALLVELVARGTAPAVARASALLELRMLRSNALPALLMRASSDPSPVVRRSVAVAARELPDDVRPVVTIPLLSDSARAVRIEAAATLLGSDPRAWKPADRRVFDVAVAEYEAARSFASDRGEGLVDLAHLAMVRRDPSRAEAILREALSVDPTFTAAHVNLADLYRVLRRQEDSEQVLRHALDVAADQATVEHALGLALVRLQRHDEALLHLRRAYTLRPEMIRFGYVFAIAAFDRERHGESLSVLRSLHQRYPANVDILNLLVAYNRELGRNREAARFEAKLSALTASTTPFEP